MNKSQSFILKKSAKTHILQNKEFIYMYINKM